MDLTKILGEDQAGENANLQGILGQDTVFTPVYGAGDTGFGGLETTFNSRFNRGLTPGIDPNSVRRGNQKWYDILGASVTNTAAEIGLGALEGFGYLGDLQQWGNIVRGVEEDYSNWFSDLMKQAKESVRNDIAPIYTDQRDEGFKPWNPRWWATNLPTIGSAVALMIPATTAVKGTSALAKGLTGQRLLSKISPEVTAGLQGVTAAGFSRYMEGTMEANQAAEAAYQAALDAGKNDEQAREIAGETAAGTFNKNLALFAFDVYQYGKLFKSFDAANAAKQLGTYSISKEIGKQALSEGAEEVFQFVAAKESEREALLNHNVIQDNRTFANRVIDYAKDPELWTSFLFGSIGGGLFGGVSEYQSNKTNEQKRQFADVIKPELEFEKAVYQGDKERSEFIQDEEFVKLATAHAKNGTIFKAAEHLDDWGKRMLELSDVELEQQGTSRQEVESIINSRKTQLDLAASIYNEINKENLSDDLKTAKFSISLGKNLITQRKNTKNQEFETLLSEIGQDNQYSAELQEIKKLRTLRNAYIDARQPEIGNQLNTRITALQEQAKQMFPNIDIKEAMNHSKNDQLKQLADEFVELDTNERILDNELSKFSSNEGIKQVQQEVETLKQASSETQFNDLVNSIHHNTNLYEFNQAGKVANRLGKNKEWDEFKENYVSNLRTNAGLVDMDNLIPSVIKRYEDNLLLFEIEGKELSQKLNIPTGFDEELLERRYNENPRNKKIIDNFYNEINRKVSERLEKEKPDFDAQLVEFSSSDSSIEEQTTLEEVETNTKIRQPFFTVGEQFEFQESPFGWVTVYENGNPKPTTKTNEVNWEEVNKPEFGLKGTNVFYEYNPNSPFNKTERGKTVDEREIQAVIYKDGNTFNKDVRNRIVIGTLPAYKSIYEYSDIQAAFNLNDLRHLINERLKNITIGTDIISLGIQTKVENKLPGRVWGTNILNAPHEILNEGETLIYGIGRIANGIPYLDVPGYPAAAIRHNQKGIRPGFTYLVIKAANGQLTATKLYTKKLKDLPVAFNRVKEILSSIQSNEDWTNFGAQQLSEIVGFPKDKVKFNNGVIAEIDGVWQNLNNDETLGNLIAQVDVNKINKGNYNQIVSEAGVLTTNINPNNHFHSAKFELSPIWNDVNETSNIQESQRIIEKTPITKSKINIKPMPNISLPTFGGFIIGDPDDKLKVSLDVTYEKWDKEKELAWWNNKLPSVPIEVLDHLHEVYRKGGFQTWGIFKNASAYIWENAGQGTAFHEAFHAVFNLYLKNEERALIFDEAANKFNVPRNMESRLEEELADAFSEYVISQERSGSIFETIKNRILNFFKGLYQYFKSIFTKDVNIDDLFSKIQDGFYVDKNFVYKNNDYWNNTAVKFKLFIDPRKKEHYIRIINTQFFNVVDSLRQEEGYENLSDLEIVNKWGEANNMNGVLAIYSSVLKQFIEYYQNENNPTSVRLELANTENTGLIDNFATIKNGKIDQLGDYLVAAAIDLSNYGLKVDVQKRKTEELQDNPSDNKEFERIEEEDQYEGWEIKNVSISGKETLSYEVRKLLRQTIDGVLDINNKFIPILDPIFRKPIFVNFDEIYNYLERNLADIYDEDSMMNQLNYLTRFKPSIRSIKNRLDNDSKLRTQFFVNFAKAHVKYTTLRQQQSQYIDRATGELIKTNTWKIFNSNRNDLRKIILNDWIGNFKNSNRNTLIKEDGNINIEKAKNINSEFNKLVEKFKSSRKVSDQDLYKLKELLFNVGFDLTTEELKSAYEESTVFKNNTKINISAFDNFSDLLSGSTDSINLIFLKLANGKNPFEGADIEISALNRLANLKINYSKDLIQSAFRNVENKNVYSHQNPTFLSRFVKELKNTRVWYLRNDKYFTKNKWLNDIIDDDTIDIDYTYIDGVRYDSSKKGIKYTKLSTKDFEVTNLNMWLGSEKNGTPSKLAFYRLPILADSPVLAYIKFKKYKNNEIIDALYDVAVQEYERIQLAKEEKAQGLPEIANYHKQTRYIFLDFLNDREFDINSKDEVSNIIREWLGNTFNEEVESLRKLGVLDGNSLGENVSDKAKITYGNNDIDLLRDYFNNQVLANINLFQILHADPSFYKPSDLYAGKRNNQVTKPGIKLDVKSIRPFYNSIYVKDIIEDETNPSNARHSFVKSVKNILTDLNVPKERIDYIISQYSDVNTTDAQSFITLDRWKEIQVGLGRWTNNLEEAYNDLNAGNSTPKHLNIVLQPIKPFYYNQELVNGKIIPTQNKNSEAVLLPQLVKRSPELSKLLEYMNKNSVDSVQFTSAVKVGEFGAVEMNNLLNGTEIPIVHRLSNDYYLVQQEVPVHHLDDENLFGTQIRKLILTNIDKTKKYLNDLNGEQVLKLYNQLIDINVTESFNKVANKFDTLENISFLIKEEIRNRKLGQNFEELAELEKGPTGEVRFKYPLFWSTQSHLIESLLSSVFKNNVTKQKINGASFVLTSNFGFADNLKIIINEETKVIEYMEVYAPWWSDDFAPTFPNGEIDMRRIDPKLREAIGYRIPTESEGYSVKRIKVKRFLPKEAGGSIILPSEITKIAGEDFDIDKLYVMLPSFEVVGNRAVKVEYDYNKSPEEQSKAARDNALLDIISSIWSSTTTTQEIVTPGGYEVLKELRTNMNLVPSNRSIALPAQQRTIFERNMTGANLIGIFALHNTSHAVGVHNQLSFKRNIKFDKKKISIIDPKFDSNNDLVSRNLATLVSASVDNAKDPILSDLNINSFTADILTTILRTGYSLETAIYFLNQPIIKEFTYRYMNTSDFNKSTIIAEQLFEEYNNKFRELSGELFAPKGTSNLSTSMMLNDIVRQDVDKNYYRRQMRTLVNFLTYKELGEELSNFVNITKPDTAGLGSSIAESVVYINNVDKFLEKGTVNGADQLFEESNPYSIVRTFYINGIKKPLEILNRFYPYQNSFFQTGLEAIRYNKQKDLTEREINHFNREAYRFYLSDFFDSSEMLNLIENLPDRLEEYKANNINKLGNYQLIANLKVTQPTNEIPYKQIEFHNNISITNEQKNYLMDSWEYMARQGTEQEQKLANDLIKYSYFTSGYQFNPKSFAHLIPHSYLREIRDRKGERFIDVLYRLQEESKDNYNVNEFIDQYVRNFYKELESIPMFFSNSKHLTTLKKTKNGNISSVRIEDTLDSDAIIGWNEENIPIFKPYISIKYKINNENVQRLYKFAGLSSDIDNAGVYHIIPDLGISGFAAEYNMDENIISQFKKNYIPQLSEDHYFNTLNTIIQTDVEHATITENKIGEVVATLQSEGIENDSNDIDNIINEYIKHCKDK